MFSKELVEIVRNSSVVLAANGFNEPCRKERSFDRFDNNPGIPWHLHIPGIHRSVVVSLATWPNNGQPLLEVTSDYANTFLVPFLVGLPQDFVFYPDNH